jgi:hypothetical protein
MLRLYLFYCDLSLIISHGHVLQCCLNKDRIMLTSCIRLHPVYMFYQLPNDVQIADRYLVVAICRFEWFLAINTELSGTT